MRFEKLETVDAFVAIDLAGAEVSSGPVRWARRVLQSSTAELARSQTYSYAALEMRRGGASAGISAAAPDRAAAVAAFVREAEPLAAAGSYLPDAAKGVSEADLAPLRAADPRAGAARSPGFAAECDGLSAAVAAEAAVGLEGRTASIEGFAASGPALARALVERGATIVAVADGSGALLDPAGLDAVALTEAWDAHGPGLAGLAAALITAGEIDPAMNAPAEAVWATPAEVCFAGSKLGVVKHDIAEGLGAMALVPCGRLAYTAKSLAVCRRRSIVAVADFVALAGSTIAAWSRADAGDDEVSANVIATVATLMAEAMTSDEGPFLGACRAAEAFLAGWQDELPFGRPLAP